jgi:hypothetical protein
LAELTEKALDALLASLGRDESAVAASLRERGLKGRPRVNCDCPLARLLRSEFPGHTFNVSPFPPWATMLRRESGCGRVEIDGEGRALLPEACADFALGFDKGEYPDLVEGDGYAR